MSTARLLGISILYLLLVRNSESASDEGIAHRMIFVILSLPGPILQLCFLMSPENLVCAVVLLQYLLFLRSREPSMRTLCPSCPTGTLRTRIPAPGPASDARRSTTAWLLCKKYELIAHV